jgi:flagellin-like protein
MRTTTSTVAARGQERPAPSGEAMTRRAVTSITAAIVVMAFAFSLGNVTRLCLDLGIAAWIAWLIGPSVDLSVVGLLLGVRFLSQHGYTDAQLARLQRMLRFCGLLTLALNTAGACVRAPPGRDRPGRRRRPSAADRLERPVAPGCCGRSTPSARPPHGPTRTLRRDQN